MNNLSSKKEMPFLAHLEELRNHLLRAFLGIAIGAGLMMINRTLVFDYILFAPAKADFITYRLFNFLGRFFHQKDLMILPGDLHIQNRQLLGQFNTYIWVSLLGGIILAFPYIFYELWRFIRPGLSAKERNYSRGVVLGATVLFICGLLFGYFVLCPMAIQFGYSFRISHLPENIFDLSDYISIVTHSTLSMGLVFLFPLAVFFLTKIGLIGPEFLRTYRKHALLLMLVVASAITPSDLLSMIIATIPLIALYELSILTCVIVSKKAHR